MNFVPWAPLAAASLHIVEEFFFPGGFAEWDRFYRSHLRSTITPRFHIIINGLLLLLCFDVGTLGLTRTGVAVWLTVSSLLATNGVWHAVGAYRTRRYSPGMITGLLLYIPMAAWGFVYFVRSQRASVSTAIIALLVGASYHLWIGKAIHRWRSRRRKGRL